MRYGTQIENGIVYVDADVGRVEIGPISDIVEMYDETHEKTYDDWEKERYGGDLDMSDEGLETPVRNTVENMTHSKMIVQSLKSKALEPNDDSDSGITRRMMLFIGMVGEVLDEGLET